MQEYLTKNHSFNNRSHSNYHTLEFCLKEVRRKENFPDQYERRVFLHIKIIFRNWDGKKKWQVLTKKCPCPKHWAWILSKSISTVHGWTSMGMSKSHQSWNLIRLPFLSHVTHWGCLHSYLKIKGNLQPRQIWLIGSGLFDSNAAHLEIVVLYLYQPAAKEALLLKWQRLGGSLEAKRIRRLICFYTFIWKSQDDTFSVTGNMRSEVLCKLEGWAFSWGKWVCPWNAGLQRGQRECHELLKTE